MKICLFVTGYSGAGKTTLVNRLGGMGWRTVHSGDIFRSLNPVDRKITGQNAVADPDVDKHVFDELLKVASSGDGRRPDFIAVESVPRSPRQVPWVFKIRDMGYYPLVVMMTANHEVRHARITNRGLSNRTPQVDSEKLVHEGVVMDEVRGCLENNGVPFTIVDSTYWHYDNMAVRMQHGVPFRIVDEMTRNIMRRLQSPASRPSDAELSVTMLGRAGQEMRELLSALPTDVNNPAVDKRKIAEETCDTLWFLLLSASLMGVSSEDVFKSMVDKYTINNHRIDNGLKPNQYNVSI